MLRLGEGGFLSRLDLARLGIDLDWNCNDEQLCKGDSENARTFQAARIIEVSLAPF